MKNILKNIAGAFVEVKESSEPDTPAPVAAAQPNPFLSGLHGVGNSVPAGIPTVINSPVSYAPQVTSAELDSKFVSHIDGLMNSANLPGPDYYEFSKMINSLSAVPDIKTRYTAAFAALQAQGVTKELLLSSAKQYLDILSKDNAGFNSALQDHSASEINNRQNKMQDASAQIESNIKQIQFLTEENNRLALEIQSLNDEIVKEKTHIESSVASYNKTLSYASNRIQDDINLISQYL